MAETASLKVGFLWLSLDVLPMRPSTIGCKKTTFLIAIREVERRNPLLTRFPRRASVRCTRESIHRQGPLGSQEPTDPGEPTDSRIPVGPGSPRRGDDDGETPRNGTPMAVPAASGRGNGENSKFVSIVPAGRSGVICRAKPGFHDKISPISGAFGPLLARNRADSASFLGFRARFR
jgi:hypothetical protein